MTKRHQLLRDSTAGIIRRDAAIYFSYRLRLASQLALALFSLTLFHYLSRLVGVERFPTPQAYFAYVTVGLVILHSLNATMALVPNSIRTELVAGTFERLVTAPMGPAAGIAAMTIFPAIAALFVGGCTLAMAIVLYDFPINGLPALLAIPTTALAVVSFLPFALLVASAVLVSKQAGNIGNLVVVGLSLAGGVYYPPDLMPGWIRWVSDVQPFTPTLELLRHFLIDTPTTDPVGLELFRLAAFALIATPLAYRVLLASVGLCRRRGNLVEY